MTIGLTRTLEDYLAYALAHDRLDARDLPVFDPTNRHLWPRRIAKKLGLPVVDVQHRERDIPPPHEALRERSQLRQEHLVVCVARDGFHYPAAVFALAKRAFLEPARTTEQILDLVRRHRGARYLTIAGPSSALGFAILARLHRAFPRLRVGVLAAESVAKLSELVFKTLIYPCLPAEADTLIAPLLKGDSPLVDGRLTSYPQGAVEPEALSSRSDLQRVLSVITHGSEDYLRLTPSDLLCGLTDNAAELAVARKAAGPLPACMQGYECVYPESRRFDPAQIPAQVVFANACLTVKLGTQLLGTHNRFTVAQRFLDGWAGSYVASPLLKDGSPAENLLFHRLLDEGLSVGQAVELVNENLARWGIDAPAVFVMGDPEAVYASGPSTLTDSARHEEINGQMLVHFESALPAYVRMPLKDPALIHAYQRGRLEVRPSPGFGGHPPYYSAVGEIDGEPNLFVLGFTERPLLGHQTACTLVVAERGLVSDAERISAAMERYDNLSCLDIKLERARSVLGEMANQLPVLARRAKTAGSELTGSDDLRKSIDRILARCGHLDRLLLETLLRLTETREYHFVEAYRPTYTLEEAAACPAACGYCGEVVYRYVNRSLLRPHLRRYLISCPVCGATSDTEDESVRISVAGDNRLLPQSDTTMVITIDNAGDEDLKLLLGARITRGKPHGFEFRLEPETVRVPARGHVDVDLAIRTGEPQIRHTMLLRFYAVGLGRIFFAGRDLWIR